MPIFEIAPINRMNILSLKFGILELAIPKFYD